jgi:hypothetical protein
MPAPVEAMPGGVPGDLHPAGLVLCRVGTHRLAFPAQQVASIELWTHGGRAAPHARRAFALPEQEGRLLIDDQGAGVVVDTLEIWSERALLVPTPPMLQKGAGGALRGFLPTPEGLWPVLWLSEFSRYLGALPAEEGNP